MSRYEQFVENAQHRRDTYYDELSGDGSFDYHDQVTALIQLSNQLNAGILVYLFGEQTGMHLAEKFILECDRNLLRFFSCIDSQYRFYILYELKTNKTLFANG